MDWIKIMLFLLPKELRDALLKFFNKVYRFGYPKEWSYQILRSEAKKVHTADNPKFRGVAISSMLSTLYDIMIDNRFKTWYKINPEQAGFRERQGCIIQLVNLPDSFLRGYHVFQLTDDTSIVTTSFEDLSNAFEQLMHQI